MYRFLHILLGTVLSYVTNPPLLDSIFDCFRVRVQHAARDANGAPQMSKAHVFDVNVLNHKQILGPQMEDKASRQRPKSRPKHVHTKHQDVISWQLRTFAPSKGCLTRPVGRNREKIPRCTCDIAPPLDKAQLVRHNTHAVAASIRAFASSAAGIGSVWGPVLPPFTACGHRDMGIGNDPLCWVSQNKVAQP